MDILMTTSGGFIRGMEGWPEYGLARTLIERGHKVTALTSSSVINKFKNAKKIEIIDGIHVIRFNPLLPFSFIWMMKHSYKFDIIHTHFPGYMAPLSSYAALYKFLINNKKPLIHTVHGIYHDPFLVEDIEDPFSSEINYENFALHPSSNPIRTINWVVHLPILVSDIIFSLTRFEKKELSTKLGIDAKKIKIVPNGIFIDKYKKQGSFKDKFKIRRDMILFVGQPRRRKSPETLLMAFKQVLEYYKDVELVFIGYKKNKYLESLARNLGVSENVKFIGFVEEQDKINAYAEASVFVLPSNYEGFGIVFIEAMAMGTPIVSTQTPGISEIVKNRTNGILVEPKNYMSLAKAIIEILTNKSLKNRLKRNNLRDVKKYDWKKIAKRVEKIYQNLI